MKIKDIEQDGNAAPSYGEDSGSDSRNVYQDEEVYFYSVVKCKNCGSEWNATYRYEIMELNCLECEASILLPRPALH